MILLLIEIEFHSIFIEFIARGVIMKRYFLRILLIFLILLCAASVSGCVSEETADTTVSTSGSTSDPVQEKPDGPYRFRSSELDRYVIVYDSSATDYYRLALELERQIYSKYGKRPALARDVNTDPSMYEILLGDVEGNGSKGRIMEYSIRVEEGRLVISSGGAFSAEKAVSYLCEHLFDGEDFALELGEYKKESFLSGGAALSDGSSARIMSANLLADDFAADSYDTADCRAELFAGMLISYTPDVLGLQETDQAWGEALDVYLPRLKEIYGISYSRHLDMIEGKINYTSLLYRSDKLRVEESGAEIFSWWTDPVFNHTYHMRNISWARFSPLENEGESFIVANTHWSYRTEHANGSTYLSGADAPVATNELRNLCKNETSELMSSLAQSHADTPIFLTGDFNTSLSLFTDYGWTPASFRIISEEARTAGTAISTVPQSNHFDHIFGTGDYSVKRYEFFKDVNHHSALSDHPFVYADVNFSGDSQ